jgi:hypothetical protein
MAIRQSAAERRALMVRVPLSSWQGNLPGPARTSADLYCPASPALPVPAIPPTLLVESVEKAAPLAPVSADAANGRGGAPAVA